MIKNDVKVIIPAAGKGSRSGLNFPKTLYSINDKTILDRTLFKLKDFDIEPIVIINPKDEHLFLKEIKTKGIRYVYQKDQLGMGHALLMAEDMLSDEDTVILQWSDLPLIDECTIKKLMLCHQLACNDFSFATYYTENSYTIVKRNQGKVQEVLETKGVEILQNLTSERDIGLFIFKKNVVFPILKNFVNHAFRTEDTKEIGFLNVIKVLVENRFKVEGYCIANEHDTFGFNSKDDLLKIQDFLNRSNS